MASESDLELDQNIIASTTHLTLNAGELLSLSDSRKELDQAPTGPFDIEPEYATGLRLTIIITTICFSTLLTALDLVSTGSYTLAWSARY